jgi:protease secretion system membrane fusion protein
MINKLNDKNQSNFTNIEDSENKENFKSINRLAMSILGFGLGGFLLFAALVPLDEGVPTHGVVVIDTKRKVVQHISGGIVKEVLVREGQLVKKDEPLIRLGSSTVKANFETIRQQYYSLKAIEARLIAEQIGSKNINFDPVLLKAVKEDPKLNSQILIQNQLLIARQASLRSAIGILRETSLGYESMVKSSAEIGQNKFKQLESLEHEFKGIRDLVSQGFLPQNKLQEFERNIAEIKSQIADNSSNQIRAKQSILEFKQRELSALSEHQREIEQQLSELRPDLQSMTEKFKAVSEELQGIEIKSPVEGQVVGLTVQTIGSVIQPAQKIMDIVPNQEELILETKIPPNLIDRIKLNDDVDVRFSGFSDTPQLVVSGVLSTISADTISEPNSNNPPYYLARVTITAEGLKKLGERKMQPGMMVEVVIKTGSRTLLNYLIHPLIKRISASMKEQ